MKQAGTDAPLAYVGGFYALYGRDGRAVGDPNTETTAYALLALNYCDGPQPSEDATSTHAEKWR